MEPDKQEDKVKEKKITQLVLSTPGACFLCLEATKTDTEEGHGPAAGDLNGGIINLSRICRYLNINQCSLLLTSLEYDNGGASGSEQQLCSFSVKLCPKCLELTENLNETLIQLEKTKLMVNYHLQLFHKILEGKKQEDKEVEVDTNSLEAKLVQLFREEVANKSLKILKKREAAMPQVILSKCQVPPHPIPSRSTSIKTLIRHLVTSNVIPSSTSNSSPRKSKLYRCPYCSKILGLSKFPLHLSSLHSDKLLSSHFPPPSLPPSESLCRQVLHTKVIGKAKKIPSSSSPSFPRWCCHLCGLSFSHGNVLKHHFLITHTDKLCEEINKLTKVPSKAVKIFEEKSQPINQSINKSSKGRTTPIKKLINNYLQKAITGDPSTDNLKFVKRYQCPFCPKFPVYSKFARHLANRHSDKLLSSASPNTAALDKLKNDKPNYFSQLCRKVLASQVKKITSKKGSGPSKLSCHLCPREYSEGQNLKHHFVVTHSDYLCKELIKIGKDKKIRVEDKLKKKMVIGKVTPTTLKDEPLKRRRGRPLKDKHLVVSQPSKKLKRLKDKLLKKKKLKRSPQRSLEHKTCTICRLIFSKYDKLQRHLVNKHPDQLFLEGKPEEMGDMEWRDICKGFFGGEVKRATYGRPGGKVYKCGYCPQGGGEKSYKGADYLVVHLAYQHPGEMEGRLGIYCGGDLGGDGDHMVVEEDASEFDMKPDIGEMDDKMMLYPDMVLDELNDKQDEAYQMTEDTQFEELELEVPNCQTEQEFIKMEVNHDVIDYFG